MPTDWPTVVAEFDEKFAGKRWRKPPTWRMSGPNFVTSDILGMIDVDGLMVEISTGTMEPLTDDRIFGVTFPPDPIVNDRSSSFWSLDDVFAYCYPEE